MSWKIFFTRFQFACDLFDALNQDYNKSFDFYCLRDFSVILKVWFFFFFFFLNLTTDFENRHKHRFKTTAGPMKSPSIYMYIHIL